MNKSILIVTEQFTVGGLETHIQGEAYALMALGWKVHIAVGKPFRSDLLPVGLVSVNTGLPFGPDSDSEALIGAVNALRIIVKENAIGVIHIHPFTSIIPAVIAAQLEDIPYGLTLHGPLSLNGYGPFYEFLLRDVILPEAGLVACVSPELSQLVSHYAPDSAVFFPNAVDFDYVNEIPNSSTILPDSRWVVVSRLDQFKIVGILDFIRKAKKSGITGVVVIGDGPARGSLEAKLQEECLFDFVSFIGFRSHIQSYIKQYAGLAGMGRVVLEGIASKKPVMLVGYDGVKGILDQEALVCAAWANFSGRGMLTIDQAKFSLQIEQVPALDLNGLFKFAKDRYDQAIIWRMFEDHLVRINPAKQGVIIDWFQHLVFKGICDSTPYLQLPQAVELFGETVTASQSYQQRVALAYLICKERLAERTYRQALVEQQAQIDHLSRLLAEQDAKIADFELAGTSNDWKYTHMILPNFVKIIEVVRLLQSKTQYVKAHLKAFWNVMVTQGPKSAIIKTNNWIKRNYFRGKIEIGKENISNQEKYLLRKKEQSDYIFRYMENGIEEMHANVLGEKFLELLSNEKIVVYPLSYPIEITQRPDHILRCFAESHYVCLILQIDNNAPFFKEIAPNRYLTNVFAGTVSFLETRKVVLYLTYPFFGYLLKHLPQARCCYDVLDDLSVFSFNCEAMKEDHNELLRCACVVTFSSNELLIANKNHVMAHSFLVKNGVWVDDFINYGNELYIERSCGEYIIGYHGAISELINWRLLEKIIEIPNVRLVMIGPLVAFGDYSEESKAVQERVLSSSRVTYIQPVPYSDLKNYLKSFDAGIVPFLINKKTDPVLPLKLFEYMALGLPIYATKTKSLIEYSGSIIVGTEEEILTSIRREVTLASREHQIDYSKILSEVDWAKQMAPVISSLNESQDTFVGSSRKVDIVNINFFDWDGKVLYKGGAERYVYDLACLLSDAGWEPRIIQNANKGFSIDFRGIPVIGVQTNSGGNLSVMSKKFRSVCKESDLIIASPIDLACELYGLKVIGINHGIYWDHKLKKLNDFNVAEYKNLFSALRIVRHAVAVDTNFINWMRTYDYALASKITYVPNYYNPAVFYPIPKDFDSKIRVLYPRRLYEARGIFIALKAFEYLFQKYVELELHLVGQANESDGKIISRFIDKYKDRVLVDEFDMDDMYQAYSSSHIVIIPTLYAEGTSLSCIEAMATNNAIVATNIGGLPNLIVDGFNGFLINPTVVDLICALDNLLQNRGLMREMASKGLEVSASFDKDHWSARWKKIISEAR